MAIDFPANPTTGSTFTSGGSSWTWDGAKWVPAASGQNFLPITGGQMTGPLLLSGDPSAALGASTKQYSDAGDALKVAKAGDTMTGALVLAADPASALQPVTKQYFDARPMIGDNRLINGDMRNDQRNSGASITPTANTYTVDRWQYVLLQPSKFQIGRNLGPPSVFAPGFPYCLGFSSTSAYAVPVGETFFVNQTVEADMVSDFAWGTAGAQPVTLSFWALSSLTGTFSGSIRNAAGPPNRSYPFTFSIPAVNTWTRIVITIPGDTTGTWVMSGNALSMTVNFDLGSGATYRAAAGAWIAGNFVGATGSVNVVSTNSATFYLTGVKLEIGSVATPFPRQSITKSVADCQRYYQVTSGGVYCVAWAPAAGPITMNSVMFKTPMRAAPTATILGAPSYVNSSALAVNSINFNLINPIVTATAGGNTTVIFTIGVDAEL